MKRTLKYFALLVALFCPSMTHAKPRKSRRARTTIKKPIVAAKKIKITPAMLRGKIVFMQDFDLWAMKPDGSGRIKILSKPFVGAFSSSYVSFSPDLTQIALVCGDPKQASYSNQELFIMRLDGTQRRQLTNRKYAYAVLNPRFSPDGKQIVYERGSGMHMGGPMNYYADVWVVNIDGSDHHRVTDDNGYGYYNPCWSRDGKRIYYTRIKDGIYEAAETIPKGELWSIKLDGSDEKSSIGQESQLLREDISPDGKWLAYRREDLQSGEREWRYGELMLRSLASGEEKRLTFNRDSTEYNIAWGSDSRHLSFYSVRSLTDNNTSNQQSELWTANVEGTAVRPLDLKAHLIAWLP